jgi:DNA adenine methylase
MVREILKYFPNHSCFVDVFGGAGSILFTKNRSRVEIYNDINSFLVSFFLCIISERKTEQVLERLEMLPYSRQISHGFVDLYRLNSNELSDIDKAVIVFYMCNTVFSGNISKRSFSHSKLTSNRIRVAENKVVKLRKYSERLRKRLKGVCIENLEWWRVIELYDGKDTLFYLDPPYIPETTAARTNSDIGYTDKFDIKDHKMLVNIILRSKGMFVLSGYKHPVYDRLVNRYRWKSISYVVKSSAAREKTRKRDRERVELLYISPNAYERLKSEGIDNELLPFEF